MKENDLTLQLIRLSIIYNFQMSKLQGKKSHKIISCLGIFYLVFFLLPYGKVFGQFIPAGTHLIEENIRRNQILNGETKNSMLIRPVLFEEIDLPLEYDSITIKNEKFEVFILPIQGITSFNNKRPYGRSDFGMVSNVGIQQYISGGIYSRWKFINFQFQPEIVFAENKRYEGFSSDFDKSIILDRFHFWNYDDSPERFGEGGFSELWFGQSSLTLQYGVFEFGVSTRSIWWGPGQWNSLTFSNNAKSFPHISINTVKPAKTFIGSFEGQMVMGKLTNSGLGASQNKNLNNLYFEQFTGDWRYLNAITITYNPKWISGLFLGFSRTFQQYNENRGNSFDDFFPVFQVFQKQKFINSDNPTQIDDEARDQQATVFGRYVNIDSKIEIYFEYGRRDHALNWREFLLNPEHARAYLMGFKKLFPISKQNTFIQVRGEITHQQESINRYIRYLGLGGEASWHTHYQVRGFVNNGQPLGVGIGTGANVQTLEISLVEKLNKLGILFERLENHQDFFYRAFGQQQEHKPWVDLSLGFLFDHQWNNLLLSSKLQLINGLNYQWQLHPNSTPDFPRGKNLFSIHSQLNLIYFLNSRKK